VELKKVLNTCTVAKDEIYARWIEAAITEEKVLHAVVELAFGGTERERTRACWILHHIGDRKAKLLNVFVPRMIEQLDHSTTDAEVRFILRYFATQELPERESDKGLLLDYSWNCMTNPKAAIAPRVYAMTIAYKMCGAHPELAQELAQTIENVVEYGSAGMKNRGGKIMQWLRRDGLL